MNNSAVASLLWCAVSGQVGFLGRGRLGEEAAGLGLRWWASEVEELRGAQESDPSLHMFVCYSYSMQFMGHNKRLPTCICCFNTQRGRDLPRFCTGGPALFHDCPEVLGVGCWRACCSWAHGPSSDHYISLFHPPGIKFAGKKTECYVNI